MTLRNTAADVVIVGDLLRLCAAGANQSLWRGVVTSSIERNAAVLAKPQLFAQQACTGLSFALQSHAARQLEVFARFGPAIAQLHRTVLNITANKPLRTHSHNVRAAVHLPCVSCPAQP